jgi:thiol-disulfide isomerase/thioredoxin
LYKVTKMKNCLIILFFIGLCKTGVAQTDSTKLYYQYNKVPAFTITTLPDSGKFTQQDLVKVKPTLIIFFSPDCEHCQKETQQLTANMGLLKGAKILMVSAMEHSFNKKFYTDYTIAKYPNIILGREPTMQMGTYFKVHTLPTAFLYTTKGEFVQAFKGTIPVAEIAKILYP